MLPLVWTVATAVLSPRPPLRLPSLKPTAPIAPPNQPAVPAEPLFLTIDGAEYDLTEWADSHPGGAKLLRKFNGRDATKAFAAAGHSKHAHLMLREFATGAVPQASPTAADDLHGSSALQKLFTHEDRLQVKSF